MKQVAGQIDIFAYIKERDTKVIHHCGQCICENCLYWWSGRCSYGRCFDDYRAKENPYDKAHPDKPPRKAWNTRKPMQNIVERLEEELELTDKEKRRCVHENPLQFDEAKGYARGIANAIEIVKEEGVRHNEKDANSR